MSSRRDRINRLPRSRTTFTYKRINSQSGLDVLAAAIEWYQKAFLYRSYHLIYYSARNGDDMTSEMQEMRRDGAIQMKDKAFNGQVTISVISFFTEVKRVCDSS